MSTRIVNFKSKRKWISLLTISLVCYSINAQSNLAVTGTATSNNTQSDILPNLANDGDMKTLWVSDTKANEKWLGVELPSNTDVSEIKIHLDYSDRKLPKSYSLQVFMNGRWREFVQRDFGTDEIITVHLEEQLLTDQIRFSVESDSEVAVKEFEIFGTPYTADLSLLKEIRLNQSGYNLGKPKRFTTPNTLENTPFFIMNLRTKEITFKGKIVNHIGDFTDFNPTSKDEFSITIGDDISYPFRIGPYWLERISYQNMIDFMIGARHYTGTSKEQRRKSWEWRDGDVFSFAAQGLIAQYLSNPEGYERLEQKVTYIENESFPEAYKGFWGMLEPYAKNTPDILKLIHWDIDVKISQGLNHELQKAELAHFLYAYPYLKEWLPKQNFDIVYEYVLNNWAETTVKETSTTIHDESDNHDLLALKTKMGTNKGALPPGHSIIPNLMLYEVVKTKSPEDAQKYFDAAFKQMEWMIAHLDWKDPMTTKGQRMSEHITMRAFAYFYQQYPERAPKGLQEKVEDWAEVVFSRSQNMWDFRKYTDDAEWAPIGWNETGNILGFPAAALAAKSVIEDEKLKKRLDLLAWSHFDNAFGRNPVGRHYSFDGPKEIEGVELGWYNAHEGGIGLLEPVGFVFDGSPKAEHYPNHPELGNIGWTEGWVQFNVAFNTSMAYLAHDETTIELTSPDKNTIQIRLKAPLNFREDKIDSVLVDVATSNGEKIPVKLMEESPYSKYLTGTLRRKKRNINNGQQRLRITKGDTLSTSYGLGYFNKSTQLIIE